MQTKWRGRSDLGSSAMRGGGYRREVGSVTGNDLKREGARPGPQLSSDTEEAFDELRLPYCVPAV